MKVADHMTMLEDLRTKSAKHGITRFKQKATNKTKHKFDLDHSICCSQRPRAWPAAVLDAPTGTDLNKLRLQHRGIAGEALMSRVQAAHPDGCGQGNAQACRRRGRRCALRACARPGAPPGWPGWSLSPRTPGSSMGRPGTGCHRSRSAGAGCSSSCSDLQNANRDAQRGAATNYPWILCRIRYSCKI